MDKKGNILFLFFKPGILNIRRVISKLVNDNVEAVPVSNIAIILTSKAPKPE
jgi:hypothetical protein